MALISFEDMFKEELSESSDNLEQQELYDELYSKLKEFSGEKMFSNEELKKCIDYYRNNVGKLDSADVLEFDAMLFPIVEKMYANLLTEAKEILENPSREKYERIISERDDISTNYNVGDPFQTHDELTSILQEIERKIDVQKQEVFNNLTKELLLQITPQKRQEMLTINEKLITQFKQLKNETATDEEKKAFLSDTERAYEMILNIVDTLQSMSIIGYNFYVLQKSLINISNDLLAEISDNITTEQQNEIIYKLNVSKKSLFSFISVAVESLLQSQTPPTLNEYEIVKAEYEELKNEYEFNPYDSIHNEISTKLKEIEKKIKEQHTYKSAQQQVPPQPEQRKAPSLEKVDEPPQPLQQPMYGQMPQQPMYDQSMYGQPPYGYPGYGQPMYDQSMYGQPMYGQQMYGQPMYGQPMYGGMPWQPMNYGGMSVQQQQLDAELKRREVELIRREAELKEAEANEKLRQAEALIKKQQEEKERQEAEKKAKDEFLYKSKLTEGKHKANFNNEKEALKKDKESSLEDFITKVKKARVQTLLDQANSRLYSLKLQIKDNRLNNTFSKFNVLRNTEHYKKEYFGKEISRLYGYAYMCDKLSKLLDNTDMIPLNAKASSPEIQSSRSALVDEICNSVDEYVKKEIYERVPKTAEKYSKEKREDFLWKLKNANIEIIGLTGTEILEATKDFDYTSKK